MRAVILLLGLVSVAIVGGCIGTDDDPNVVIEPPVEALRPPVTPERLPAAAEDLSNAIDPDHGGLAYLHAVPDLHTGSSGIELVGYNPLTRPADGDLPGAADSAYNAVDTWKNLVCVGHFAGSTGALGGATLVDIADPANPKFLASIPSGAVNSDCQFTDDGKYLLLATYTGVHAGLPLPAPVGDLAANGLSVYDVSDPADPVFLFHDVEGANEPGSGAYHNVFTAQINGTHYIFQTYTGNILKINEDASGLEMVSNVEHSDHDIWVGQHPITGEWTMVTGAAGGTAVINVDDPANPELLSVWEPDRGNRTTGWHRQWPLENTVDGKAYMIVAGEECGNGDSLPYQVLEWTDPNDLKTVGPYPAGSWWIPGRPANPADPHLCEMNSHEFEVFDGYVATGNYHAGVWVFDVGSPERILEPATIGYYLPHENPQMNGGTLNTPFVWSPNTWGAYFDERGYVITADWHSGLYVLDIGIADTE